MADGNIFNVLFLCTGNSARSIMAEAILNGSARTGSKPIAPALIPRVKIHPRAVAILEKSGFLTDGFRSKSWDEFASPGAPPLDFVFTVCDDAAKEQCPYWPGQPMMAHRGQPDPGRRRRNRGRRTSGVRRCI